MLKTLPGLMLEDNVNAGSLSVAEGGVHVLRAVENPGATITVTLEGQSKIDGASSSTIQKRQGE